MKPVLVVDDHHDILSYIKYELMVDQINTILADTIEDAISELKEIEFSCILIDIFLGEQGSSEKILSYLKSADNKLNKDVPIVIMSGMIDADFIERNSSKVFHIIEKPFENGALLQIVKRAQEHSSE